MSVRIYKHKFSEIFWVYSDLKNTFYNIKLDIRQSASKTPGLVINTGNYNEVNFNTLSPKVKEIILKDYPQLCEEDEIEDFCNQYQMS